MISVLAAAAANTRSAVYANRFAMTSPVFDARAMMEYLLQKTLNPFGSTPLIPIASLQA